MPSSRRELGSLCELDNSFEGGEGGSRRQLLRRSINVLTLGARVITDRTPEAASQADELLDAKQVADLLRVHIATVYRLADSGRLRAMRLGSGQKRRRGFRCWASAVDEYLRDSEIEAA